MLSVCLSRFLIACISYSFSLYCSLLDPKTGREELCMVKQRSWRTTLPVSSATNFEEAQWRHISWCLGELRPRQLLHSPDFAVEFCFVTGKGKSLRLFRRIA